MFFRLFFLLAVIILLADCRQAGEETPVGETAVTGPSMEPSQAAVFGTADLPIEPTVIEGVTIPVTNTAEPTADEAPTIIPDLSPTKPPLGSVWETRAPLLEANSEMAVAQQEGKLYVLGGYPASRETVTTVQVYDFATDSWTLGPPLPGPVNHTVAAAANGRVYVLGGQSSTAGGGPFLDIVYGLDPAAGTWALKAPMPRARGGGAAAVVDGKIYVAGGRPPHGQDFSVYDPLVDSWTVLPDIPTGRNHIVTAAIEGKVYVVGGRFGAGFNSGMTNVVEVYDPVTNTWSTAAPMPTERSGINGAVINGCLHIFGGEGGSGMFDQHEVYDPVTDQWFSLPPMATAVHGVTGSGVYEGWIYLPGGGTAVGGSSGSTIHQVVRTEIFCS